MQVNFDYWDNTEEYLKATYQFYQDEIRLLSMSLVVPRSVMTRNDAKEFKRLLSINEIEVKTIVDADYLRGRRYIEYYDVMFRSASDIYAMIEISQMMMWRS
jgi:hypothetical protein